MVFCRYSNRKVQPRMTPELIAAVRERLEYAYSEDAIRDELRSAGYDEESITKALAQARAEQAGGEPSANSDTTPVAEQLGASGTVALPGVTALIKHAFAFLKTRTDVWATLAGALIAMSLLGWAVQSSGDLALTVGATILLLVVLVLYLLTLIAALHIVVESPARRIPFNEAFGWAGKRLGSFVWVYLLTAFAVWGGLLLLVIPGIIVSLYIYFSQYVLAREGLRGLDALMRSRELVRGHWWALLGRLIVIGLSFVSIFGSKPLAFRRSF